MKSNADNAHALDPLNATERDLLALLGRGHTAKSIATLRSLSVAAVNERFRSARRKTGIGSSREIARLIVAQENRDDFIDLAEPADPPPELQRQDALRSCGASPLRRWRLPMVTAGLFAIAILAQQTSVPPNPSIQGGEPTPSAAEAIFAPPKPSPDVSTLHAEVAIGPADPTTETALSRTYHGIPTFSEAVESLDVTCNASLCEVLGVSRPGLSSDETNALMEAIQARDVHEAAANLKLDLVVQGFTSTKDDSARDNPTAMVFVAYWRRADNL